MGRFTFTKASKNDTPNVSIITSLSDEDVYLDSPSSEAPAYPDYRPSAPIEVQSEGSASSPELYYDGPLESDTPLRQRADYNDYKSERSLSIASPTVRKGPYDLTPLGVNSKLGGNMYLDNYDDYEEESSPLRGTNNNTNNPMNNSDIFLMPHDIHSNMENKEDEIARLRLLAGKLSADWRSPDYMAPALARRIRDFQFAQEKRRKKYGEERPWGILGLYDHLSSVRIDVLWAEDAARRRTNGEPYQSWVDFDEQKRGGSNRPYFTYFLLVICSINMIASIMVNGCRVEPLSQNPMIGPNAQTLITMGAKESNLIVNESDGWRLLSSTILHAGLVHYAINMLALWFVGAAIETSHGWIAAMIIFTISAVGGTVLSAIFLPEFITVGASGGIFGFIGACLADIIINWKLIFCDFVTENGKKHRHAMVVIFLLMDIALNSIIGLTPYVDNFTHLGGMAYGFLCGLSTMNRLSTDFFGLEEGWQSQVKHFMVRFFGLMLSVFSLVITLVILLQGDGSTNPCPMCTWLSCVPFPPWESQSGKWWYCDDCQRVTAEIVYKPHLHLEIDCPSGGIAEYNLTRDELDRDKLESDLPNLCRATCLAAGPSELN